MRILAIESSCDETAVAVVADGRYVLSSCVASQIDAHAVYGGVVPEIASRMHVEAISPLYHQALAEAGMHPTDIDAVAVTYAPGLIGALLVGVNFAKGLAMALCKPLIPVHHIRAHIAANYLSAEESEPVRPPFLALVVSGGHTQIIGVDGYTTFRILGRSRDDAVGECLDKSARKLGLPYPGGVHLDRLGQGGNPSAYRFPRPKVENAPYDFSFSGLKTVAVNLIHNNKDLNQKDFAASLQAACADYLAGHAVQAAHDFGYDTVALAGGVSANCFLRQKMEQCSNLAGLHLVLPPFAWCGDNAAMIGAQAYYEYQAGHTAGLSLNAQASHSAE
ncbi:MAG: tRNA (adenosine(37)-N6)-threonylcarbamoyltransferase complex transferase subunit TsaD [Oscillospiraceae bacterium]|jgi:N6-L-threonylcarbamoyladenine synthase|nr:tRNA (adenosine(37)-N6)-threonylcarbamoyltransferase complex transferase subunit TsaD [Oscillospiraceae bacterium]